jgi:HEPN domain-containing protein
VPLVGLHRGAGGKHDLVAQAFARVGCLSRTASCAGRRTPFEARRGGEPAASSCEDLEVARKLLADHPRQGAFHLQQSAEKLPKAVLVVEGLSAPRIHQIGALAALLPAEHPWRPDLAALDRLSSNATAWRYPNPDGGLPTTPSQTELTRSWQEITDLLEEIEPWCHAR